MNIKSIFKIGSDDDLDFEPSGDPLEDLGKFQNMDRDVDCVLEGTSDSVRKVAFSASPGLLSYNILRAPREKLAEWKKSVDEILIALKNKDEGAIDLLIRNNGRVTNNSDEIMNILRTESLDEQDCALLAIGIFVLREKAPWDFVRSGAKALKGGDVLMEDAFDSSKTANCYDIMAIVKELAFMYGISGKIRMKDCVHAYFESNTGKISDPMNGWKRSGLFQTVQSYEEFEKRRGLLRRLGLRK